MAEFAGKNIIARNAVDKAVSSVIGAIIVR